MQILCRNVRPTFIFRNNTVQNAWLTVPRANYRFQINPVKMAVKIYQSQSMNPKLSPLINMHDLLSSKQTWRTIVKELAETTKRKIYNVDARNHGESPHNPAHTSAHMVSDILYLLQEEKIRRCTLMGHCMGGRTMMFFAMKYPDVVEKAIIVDASPLSMPKTTKSVEKTFIAMNNVKISPKLSLAKGRAIAERQIRELIDDKETFDHIMLNFRKMPSGEFGWVANVSALHDNFIQMHNTQQFDMPPYTGPVLFICGKQSHYMNPNDWPKIKQIFPNANIKWMNAGHQLHFDKPAEFVKIVTEFLKS